MRVRIHDGEILGCEVGVLAVLSQFAWAKTITCERERCHRKVVMSIQAVEGAPNHQDDRVVGVEGVQVL